MAGCVGPVDATTFFTSKVKCMMSDLVNGHAYGILDAREVQNDSGQTIKLIKCRNPWGTFEW